MNTLYVRVMSYLDAGVSQIPTSKPQCLILEYLLELPSLHCIHDYVMVIYLVIRKEKIDFSSPIIYLLVIE